MITLVEYDYAHRGLWTAQRPENSMAAFDAALVAGVGIELDVRLSADGAAVVFHDADLRRMCSFDNAVRDVEAVDLMQMRLGQSTETIPLLDDVLVRVNGCVPILVELKVPFGHEGPLELAVAAALQDYDGPVAVISFNPMSLTLLRGLLPYVPRGLTTDSWMGPRGDGISAAHRRHLRRLGDMNVVKPDFLCVGADLLPNGHIQHWRRHGIPVIAWTAHSAAEARHLRHLSDAVMFEGFVPHALPACYSRSIA